YQRSVAQTLRASARGQRCSFSGLGGFPASRVDQATTFGLWNRIAKLLRRVDPETNSFLCAGERRLLAGTVCGAAGEFGHLGHVGFVLFTPINDDLVLIHLTSPT